MIEDEAKGKWCPFVRAITGKIEENGTSEHLATASPYNRIVDGGRWSFPAGSGCIGSDCMAWREQGPPLRIEEGRAIYSGYCGLAGKP